jgi:hypothetical protein
MEEGTWDDIRRCIPIWRIASRIQTDGRMLSSSFVASFVVSFVDITATRVFIQTSGPLRSSSGSGRDSRTGIDKARDKEKSAK